MVYQFSQTFQCNDEIKQITSFMKNNENQDILVYEKNKKQKRNKRTKNRTGCESRVLNWQKRTNTT